MNDMNISQSKIALFRLANPRAKSHESPFLNGRPFSIFTNHSFCLCMHASTTDDDDDDIHDYHSQQNPPLFFGGGGPLQGHPNFLVTPASTGRRAISKSPTSLFTLNPNTHSQSNPPPKSCTCCRESVLPFFWGGGRITIPDQVHATDPF